MIRPGTRLYVKSQSESNRGTKVRVEVAVPRSDGTGWVTAVKDDGQVLLQEDAAFEEHLRRYKDAYWKEKPLIEAPLTKWLVELRSQYKEKQHLQPRLQSRKHSHRAHRQIHRNFNYY